LLYALLARATPSRVLRGAGVVLMLLAPHFACVGGLGMETPLYAAFILATLHAVVAGRPVAAGVLAGLTFCTRPDGLAVLCAAVACFGLEALTGSRGAGSSTSSGRAVAWRRLLALGGGFALVAVPFAAWTWSYYGALLPGTLAAKRTHPLVSSRWWMLVESSPTSNPDSEQDRKPWGFRESTERSSARSIATRRPAASGKPGL